MTLLARICRRAVIPCTPSELSVTMRHPLTKMRACLHYLKKQGRMRRLDRSVPVESKRGRNREYLWQATS